VGQTSEIDLLREYAANRSESAFAELVSRRVHLVYSVALRLVRQRDVAEDISQKVFLLLANQASELSRRENLGSWLHATTRYTALNVLKAEHRRLAREHAMEKDPTYTPDNGEETTSIPEQLDDCLATLNEPDRECIILRYFDGKAFAEVARALGISEAAAKMRVGRALERLREALEQTGIKTSTAALGAVLTAGAAHSAPTALAATISAHVLATTSAVATVSATTLVMTTMQKAAIVAVLATALGTIVFQQLQIRSLTDALIAREREGDGNAKQSDAARRDLEAAPAPVDERRSAPAVLNVAPALAAASAPTQALGAATGLSEAELAETEAQVLQAKLELLRKKVQERPQQVIPEMALLTESDWLQTAQQADLQTERGVRKALGGLRDTARNRFGEQLRAAFKAYAKANQDETPVALEQLKPFFKTPITDDVLQRYTYTQPGKWSELPPDRLLVNDAVAAVDSFDAKHTFNKETTFSTKPSFPDDDHVLAIFDAYFAEHPNQEPRGPAELEPYARTPEQKAALKRLLGNEAAE